MQFSSCILRFVWLSLVAGCAYQSENANVLPGIDLQPYRTFHVIPAERDAASVDDAIARELSEMGFTAAVGAREDAPGDVDLLVTYETSWNFDMLPFLEYLQIDFRDPASDTVIASGVSTRSSLVRLTKTRMVREVIDNIYNDAESVWVSDHSREMPWEALVVESPRPLTAPLPVTARVIGHGAQHIPDEDFSRALRQSIAEHRLFRTVVADGPADYTLSVALKGLSHRHVHLVIATVGHSLKASSSWVLLDNESGEPVYSANLETECVDEHRKQEGKDGFGGCAVRSGIAAGIARLAQDRGQLPISVDR